MKLVLFLIALLPIVFGTCDINPYPKDYANDVALLGQNRFNEIIQCLNGSKDEILALIDIAKAIAEMNPIRITEDIVKIIKQGIAVVENCGALFCYGPSIKKCELETGGECERFGDIVYPNCADGFTNWLCCVCASTCPAGFRDDGLYCAKPQAYGRGAGYAIWDEDKCERENPQGCEKNGAMYYPKCAEGFHAVGCCICSPNCPEGWEDIGVSCKKPESYGRGVGYPVSFGLQCLFSKEDQERALAKTDTCKEKQSFLDMMALDVEDKFNQEQLQGYQITDLIYHIEELVQNCDENLNPIE